MTELQTEVIQLRIKLKNEREDVLEFLYNLLCQKCDEAGEYKGCGGQCKRVYAKIKELRGAA